VCHKTTTSGYFLWRSQQRFLALPAAVFHGAANLIVRLVYTSTAFETGYRDTMTSKAEISLPLNDDVPVQQNAKAANRKAPLRLTALLRSAQLKKWDSNTVDLRLLPVSCVDTYRDLVVRNKELQLSALPADKPQTQIAPSPAGALATRHDAATLISRCRKLELETSDSNRDIRYSLYIAAGFAVTTTDNGNKHRAPLLLIPVDLIRSKTHKGAFAIRYNGGALRLNPHIAESCECHVDQVIQPFQDAAELRDYLRATGRKLHSSLNSQVSANTGLFSLQADVLSDISPVARQQAELERTRPGLEFKALPVTPESFNSQLAIRMLRFIEPDKLDHALLNFIGTPPVEPVSALLENNPDLEGERLSKTRKCAQWLIDIGLGHWQLQHIVRLPDRIDHLLQSINTLRNMPEFNRHIDPASQTIGMLQKLYRARTCIENAPPEMQHHAISLHADPDTRLLLQKAKIQAASIDHELASASESFHLSAVPGSRNLHHLIKTIALREQASQLTNPHYFTARRQLNEILKTHNGLITDNDLRKLEALAKTLRFSELFDEDPYYRRCFGSLFDGVNTNWQRLDSVINFSRNLSYELGSSQLVGRLNESWPSFQRDFSAMTPALRAAAISAHKLTLLVPAFISNDTSIENAVNTAGKFRARVNQWQHYLRKNTTDLTSTPFAMIKAAPRDESDISVLLSPQDYDDRIYHHIIGSQLDREAVSATAQWLYNTLRHLQIDAPTVRRYLDSDIDVNNDRVRPL
jgi:hypothetical protein